MQAELCLAAATTNLLRLFAQGVTVEHRASIRQVDAKRLLRATSTETAAVSHFCHRPGQRLTR